MAARIPIATYRLQFNRQFTFAQAEEILDYLHELGVSDCYASPLFQAGPQSTHGYDVCSFERLNPDLGTVEDFERFSARLHALGLGLLLDIVPNHMGADLTNAWWLDVLRHGPASGYANWFDIDWEPPTPGLRHQVLLPVLEDHYAHVLEAGKLRLGVEDGAIALAYHDRRYPLAPGSFSGEAAELDQINGRPGEPRSFDALHALLQRQHYRLAYWRVGSEEINYRRFFDVTGLVSLRMELPVVFAATHQLVFRLIREGKVSGLRIDHPDGLWNPQQYFERLQTTFREDRTNAPADNARPLYVVVEKILTDDETLPEDWPVHGTTGYDFLNRLNGLFIHRASETLLGEIYQDFAGERGDFTPLVPESKRRILRTSLISELNALAHRLQQIATASRYGRDLSFRQLHTALAELIAAFPVYRTYTTEESTAPTASDARRITQALRIARKRAEDVEPAVWDFLAGLLRLRPPEDLDEGGRVWARMFVMRFQQLTGPVMAKGLEDTAFYRFNRLVSLNEVGGDPGRFGTDLHEFHAWNRAQAEHWPHTLVATATHDTKRGEDVRARLNVLSEVPEAWRETLERWRHWNAARKLPVEGQPAPHPHDEYLLYQTLVGAWPLETEDSNALSEFRSRVQAYMLKALREAKERSHWTDPNLAYEKAMTSFIARLLAEGQPNPFLEDLQAFQRKIAGFGFYNSLAQTLLKLSSPGVPDFYQGTELWDLNLVDPDNRRPVDYAHRRALLNGLKRKLVESTSLSEFLRGLLARSETGECKLYLIWQVLNFRQQHPRLFSEGNYLPLFATGPKQEHVCAFARVFEQQVCIAIVPRLIAGLMGGVPQPPLGGATWPDTRLPLPTLEGGAQYRNVLTREVIRLRSPSAGLPLAEALALFPVALLEPIR